MVCYQVFARLKLIFSMFGQSINATKHNVGQCTLKHVNLSGSENKNCSVIANEKVETTVIKYGNRRKKRY